MSASARRLAIIGSGLLAFVAIAAALDGAALRDRLAYPRVATEAERTAILATLDAYNKTLQDFYVSRGDPSLIDFCPTTKDLKHHVWRDLGYLQGAGLVLILDHADTTPREFSMLSPTEATATVFEEWNFLYQKSEGRRPASKPKGMGTGLRYRLRLRDGAWQITAWEHDVAPPPDKGFVF